MGCRLGGVTGRVILTMVAARRADRGQDSAFLGSIRVPAGRTAGRRTVPGPTLQVRLRANFGLRQPAKIIPAHRRSSLSVQVPMSACGPAYLRSSAGTSAALSRV